MTPVILALVVMVCAGCGTGTTISVDRVALALALGEARAQYVVIAAELGRACAEKKLSETACATLAAGGKDAEAIYARIKRALVAPAKSEGLDMEQMGEYLGVILKMAGKAAL